MNSAAWRLIVALDLPAAVNTAITDADASGTLIAAMRIGPPDRDEQKAFFEPLTAQQPDLNPERYVAGTRPLDPMSSGNTPGGHITQPST